MTETRTFLVVAAGHSGTKLLSLQLGQAPGWTVHHELDRVVSARRARNRFQGADHYGEVNTYLLASARHVPIGRLGVLLRDPYAIVRSIAREGRPTADVIAYVKDALATLDGLIQDGAVVIKFQGITSDPEYVVERARALGIDSLAKDAINTESRINHQEGAEVLNICYDRDARDEFDQFIYDHRLTVEKIPPPPIIIYKSPPTEE